MVVSEEMQSLSQSCIISSDNRNVCNDSIHCPCNEEFNSFSVNTNIYYDTTENVSSSIGNSTIQSYLNYLQQGLHRFNPSNHYSETSNNIANDPNQNLLFSEDYNSAKLFKEINSYAKNTQYNDAVFCSNFQPNDTSKTKETNILIDSCCFNLNENGKI